MIASKRQNCGLRAAEGPVHPKWHPSAVATALTAYPSLVQARAPSAHWGCSARHAVRTKSRGQLQSRVVDA